MLGLGRVVRAVRGRVRPVKALALRFREWCRYFGFRYHCPLCRGCFGRLKPSTGSYSIRGELLDHYTADSVCPRCGSGIRHRFVFSFLRRHVPRWEAGTRVLHFASEPALRRFFRCQPVEYVPCDIFPDEAEGIRKVDVTAIDFPDRHFDFILCIHVLEHVPDDRRALRELFRVLRPGGRAVIAVPTYGPTTWEDPTLTEDQREKMYGIADHRRLNGLDLQDKLRGVGFEVRLFSTDDVPGRYMDHRASSPHIDSDKYLFYCERPTAAAARAA